MKMVNNALSIGSVMGIPIRLHLSLLIAIVVLSLFSGAGLLAVLILAVGVFGSVALHELGHSVVARAKGGYIHEIVLYPFGGAAKISNLPKRPVDEMLVALAGPAVSLLLALIFRQWEITQFLGYLNTMLFLFNMLPVFPMDGGRVLRAALTIKHGRLDATRMAASVGKYFCGLFVIIGLFGMPIQLLGLIGPLRPSLMLAFIGGYIYFAGQQEYRMVMMEHQASGFSNPRAGSIEVEVSPPPYAAGQGNSENLAEKLRRLFHR
ncbi:site-2 protease family protein [Pontiella sulfatireligans]|uniref:Zinc metalloprotease Rip3 n=1 Tax=Pontiella sulfatireligans TaxID=2750658 RepID=A0A6C2UMT4_9BACT|nr:site-2 protease family protein [Pontiella sulfatireligans]VGO21253.1 Putative zinc metalloprotease Rip3 [Pontiella sulfatireligans]